MKTSEDIINMIQTAVTLKRVNRSGWAIAGLDRTRPESVAEHSYGVMMSSIFLSFYLIEKGVEVDLEKVLIMAAIHDLPEYKTSDLPSAFNQVANSTKRRMKQHIEREVIRDLFQSESITSRQLIALWKEYERFSTLEAKIVKGADIIDMLVQALIYEDSGVSPKILHQFFVSSRHTIRTIDMDIISSIYKTLLEKHLGNANQLGIHLES